MVCSELIKAGMLACGLCKLQKGSPIPPLTRTVKSELSFIKYNEDTGYGIVWAIKYIPRLDRIRNSYTSLIMGVALMEYGREYRLRWALGSLKKREEYIK